MVEMEERGRVEMGRMGRGMVEMEKRRKESEGREERR